MMKTLSLHMQTNNGVSTNMGIVYVAPVQNKAGIHFMVALDSQSHVIKFTSCLPMIGGSLRILRILPPVTKTVVYVAPVQNKAGIHFMVNLSDHEVQCHNIKNSY
jgi:mRNA-degrading endonuclease toxin of MazEF toxin-antitoxin module